MIKIFAEAGIGNKSFFSTEIEKGLFMKECNEFIELVKRTHKIDIKRDYKEYIDPNFYMQQIICETQESLEELKPDNIPYLEAELGDILWSWLMAIENLKTQGLVRGHEEIIKRALKKFQERMLPIKGEIEYDEKLWREVKQKQKEALESELIGDK